MVGIIKGDFGGGGGSSRSDSLRAAHDAALRLDNGYRKQEIQKALTNGDGAALADHVRFLDNGINRFLITRAADELKHQ